MPSGADGRFPYHDPVLSPSQAPVPGREPVFANGGIFFSMGFFSNRSFELSESIEKASVVSLIDAESRSELHRILGSEYAKNPEPGTALYYAVHRALTQIGNWDANGALTPFDEVMLVTVTDGLDTASTDPSFSPVSGLTFKNSSAYQDFIKKSIAERRFGGKKINAISIGIRGSDTIYEKDYRSTLAALASHPDNVYRIAARTLPRTLSVIANNVTNKTIMYPYSFITPSYPDGTELFIALDGISIPAKPKNFISGTVRLIGNQYILDKVTFGGSAVTQGAPVRVTGIREHAGWGIEWKFEFLTEMRPNKTVLYYRSDRNWRGSKEFSVRTWPPVYNQRSSLVYLLIDNSFSMTARNLETIRESAGIFIDALSAAGTVGVPGSEARIVYRSPASIGMRPVALRRTEEPVRAPDRSPDPVWPMPLTPDSVTGFTPAGDSASMIAAMPVLPGTLPIVPPPPRSSPPPVQAAPPPIQPALRPVPVSPPPVQPDAVIVFESRPPPPAMPRAGGRFWVQTSSHENLQIAEEMCSLLRTYRFAPVITEAQVNGKTFFRVRVGPYADTQDARRVIDYVKEPPLGFFDSFIP